MGDESAEIDKAGPPSPPQEEVTRRRFLDYLVGASLAVTGAGSAIMALAFLKAPEAATRAKTVDIGPETDLPEGEGRVVEVGDTNVIVIRSREEGLVAFSAICTHLGCVVAWDKEKQQIICPCHAAIFDTKGNVVSGPAPAPLPSKAVTVVSGNIIVGEA